MKLSLVVVLMLLMLLLLCYHAKRFTILYSPNKSIVISNKHRLMNIICSRDSDSRYDSGCDMNMIIFSLTLIDIHYTLTCCTQTGETFFSTVVKSLSN